MKTIEHLIAAAQAQGLLPAEAKLETPEHRPWPVVLLTALGAWFAAIPFLSVVAMLLGDLLNRGAGPYVVGILVLAAAIVILRSRDVSLFVEQLGVQALLVGGGTLAMGLFRDLQSNAAALILALIATSIAWSSPRTWLRILLGALACGMFAGAILPEHSYLAHTDFMLLLLLAWHATLLMWVVFQWLITQALQGSKKAPTALALDAYATGWIIATLAGLALWSGMTFLAGAAFDLGAGAHAVKQAVQSRGEVASRVVSVILTLGAAGWLALHWSATRTLWLAAAALMIAGLASQLPSLGAVLCVLVYCASTSRLKLATVAALAAAWIIGSYYYQLHYPLADKALRLLALGAVLGALAWAGSRKGMPALPPSVNPLRRGSLGIVASLILVTVVANGGIWQKENQIATGSALYVELAPVDPRSLMQGDFMQLNYHLPIDEQTQDMAKVGAERPHVVVQRDERGIATLVRMHHGEPLARNEFLIELTPHSRGWTLVSDAWYFKEGEAQRWAKAKYGEFRVAPDGRALLVNLRGPNLENL